MPERRVCVLDAGPIIHLDQLGQLLLLDSLGELFVPESVAYEAEKHRPGVTAKLGAHVVEEADLLSREMSELIHRLNLHTGEIAALGWAEKFGADLFVSDDKAARTAAQLLGIESTGTLGVIVEAFKLGICARERAIELLKAIPFQTTLHVQGAVLLQSIEKLR